MVYVPFEAVKRLMLKNWSRDGAGTPKPTSQEIWIEFFKIGEFYPLDFRAFEALANRFPPEDRKNIQFRPYTNIKRKAKTEESP